MARRARSGDGRSDALTAAAGDRATSVPDTVTVPTLAITQDNAKDLNAKLKF